MQDLTQSFFINNILRAFRVSFVSSVSKERSLSYTGRSRVGIRHRKLSASYAIFPIFARLSPDRFLEPLRINHKHYRLSEISRPA